jgi:hypothetical protein
MGGRSAAGRRRWLLVALTAVAVMLVACSSSDDAGGDDGTAQDEAGIEVREEAAPATLSGDVLVRVDAVSVDGGTIEVEATVATADEVTMNDDDVRLITNTGVELPRADGQERVIGSRSLATVTVVAENVTEEIRTLELDLLGRSVSFDVPEDGETFRWEPAPLRQVGFVDAVLRDSSPVVFVPYTFRTEGVVSEVTFMALTRFQHNPTLCHGSSRLCVLEDSSGATYPYLGDRYEFPSTPGARVRGTMRFLGQIPPDETRLRLRVEGSSGFTTIANPNFEHDIDLPRAEETELSVAAGDTRPDPFDVDVVLDDGEGLQVELGELSFADDRIQLAVTASASEDRGWDLDFRGDTRIVDPTGYDHPLMRAVGGGDIAVEADETMSATLVFLTPLAAGVDELHLELSVGHDEVMEYTIELPDRPGAKEDA